jgi:hypothetical protein
VKPKPKDRIRRFDVFAEYRKQEEHERGMPLDRAKGYGLWVAKVVAARKFRRMPKDDASEREKRLRRRRKWRVLSGERQTDKLFDHEIVERMGREFYNDVFEPAISKARERGRTYESIRDSIRRSWKPPRADRSDAS